MDFCLLLNLWIRKLLQKVSKRLNVYYSQKQPATDAPKTVSNKVIKKTEGTTGDLIGNKTFNKITKV